MKSKVSQLVFENPQMSNCMKISSVAVEVSYADGLTDRQTHTDSRTDRQM